MYKNTRTLGGRQKIELPLRVRHIGDPKKGSMTAALAEQRLSCKQEYHKNRRIATAPPSRVELFFLSPGIVQSAGSRHFELGIHPDFFRFYVRILTSSRHRLIIVL